MRSQIARGGGGDEADGEGVVGLPRREMLKRGAALRRKGPAATQLLIIAQLFLWVGQAALLLTPPLTSRKKLTNILTFDLTPSAWRSAPSWYLAQMSRAEAHIGGGGVASGPSGGPSSVSRVEVATAETARRDRGPSAAARPPARGTGSPRQPGAHRAFFAVGSGVAAAIGGEEAALLDTFVAWGRSL